MYLRFVEYLHDLRATHYLRWPSGAQELLPHNTNPSNTTQYTSVDFI